MDLKAAFRWTVYYRAAAWASALVGVGLVLVGFRLSLGGLPLTLAAAVEGAASPAFAALAVLGFVVWQAGKTAAFYKTMTEATGEQMADRFDPELIKSDILSVLDERLAEIQSQIEGTRSSVEDLETSSGFELDD